MAREHRALSALDEIHEEKLESVKIRTLDTTIYPTTHRWAPNTYWYDATGDVDGGKAQRLEDVALQLAIMKTKKNILLFPTEQANRSASNQSEQSTNGKNFPNQAGTGIALVSVFVCLPILPIGAAILYYSSFSLSASLLLAWLAQLLSFTIVFLLLFFRSDESADQYFQSTKKLDQGHKYENFERYPLPEEKVNIGRIGFTSQYDR